MIIRQLTRHDVLSAIKLERRCFQHNGHRWNPATWAVVVCDPSFTCIGAFRGNRLIGFIVVAEAEFVRVIRNLAVRKGFRREGLATALINAVDPVTSNRPITASTHDSWLEAQLCLRECGFYCDTINKEAFSDGGDSYHFTRLTRKRGGGG